MDFALWHENNISKLSYFGDRIWTVDCVGLSGGLLLLWKEELHLGTDSSSPGHIVAKIKRWGRFHFEEAWCEEEGCKELVEQHWDGHEVCGSVRKFKAKTLRVGKALQLWNKNKKKNLNGEIDKLKKTLNELSSLQQPEFHGHHDKGKKVQERQEAKWEASAVGMYNINVDVGVKGGAGCSGAGCVMRDHHEQVVFASSTVLNHEYSPVHAKLMAIHTDMCKEFNFELQC
ncbi:hypothetical protein G4B88_009887 [Cannabis sativa]|uniref:RNase H type-1 domain-containing protein n=1 Tax=Cannabis sativa TaxID=3483 RepID=A0A7J6HH56_CANSA|nr:hypothetical protein G4B88_009887 [Cannabis sativa]